jgi:hypothetical protein
MYKKSLLKTEKKYFFPKSVKTFKCPTSIFLKSNHILLIHKKRAIKLEYFLVDTEVF